MELRNSESLDYQRAPTAHQIGATKHILMLGRLVGLVRLYVDIVFALNVRRKPSARQIQKMIST